MSETKSIIASTVKALLKNSLPVRVSPTAKWLNAAQVEAEYGLKEDSIQKARKEGLIKSKKRKVNGRMGERTTRLYPRNAIEAYIDNEFEWDIVTNHTVNNNGNVQSTC